MLEEDKDFLRGQREKGRKGYMAGVDTDFARYEERMFFRRLSARARREREERRLEVSSEECGLSTGSDSDMTEAENSEDDAFNPPPQKKVSQEKQSVLTPELAALMDRMKLSARQAGALATGFAAVLGFNVSTLSTSPSTIYRQRTNLRKTMGEKIKSEFYTSKPVQLHWDGKQLRDLTNLRKVDRLPILISEGGKEHLLAVAKLSTGTGASQAIAICETLEEWNLKEMISGLNFDTTSSNTGPKNGTCALLEDMLGVELLHFACRHHTDEIVLGAVVVVCLGPTKGPCNTLFTRFRIFWDECDKTNFATCPANLIPASEKNKITEFCWNQLQVRPNKGPLCKFKRSNFLPPVFHGA